MDALSKRISAPAESIVPTADAQSLPTGLLRPVVPVPSAIEHHLFYGGSQKPIFRVVPDAVYPGMWRVVHPDGSLSDMANLTRAKDSAVVMADRGPPRRNQSLLRWRTHKDEDRLSQAAGLER